MVIRTLKNCLEINISDSEPFIKFNFNINCQTNRFKNKVAVSSLPNTDQYHFDDHLVIILRWCRCEWQEKNLQFFGKTTDFFSNLRCFWKTVENIFSVVFQKNSEFFFFCRSHLHHRIIRSNFINRKVGELRYAGFVESNMSLIVRIVFNRCRCQLNENLESKY